MVYLHMLHYTSHKIPPKNQNIYSRQSPLFFLFYFSDSSSHCLSHKHHDAAQKPEAQAENEFVDCYGRVLNRHGYVLCVVVRRNPFANCHEQFLDCNGGDERGAHDLRMGFGFAWRFETGKRYPLGGLREGGRRARMLSGFCGSGGSGLKRRLGGSRRGACLCFISTYSPYFWHWKGRIVKEKAERQRASIRT